MPELPEIEIVKRSLFKKINKAIIVKIKINNNNLALSYLDSAYTHLLNRAQGYTNQEERHTFLTFDKNNKRIQQEWEKVTTDKN